MAEAASTNGGGGGGRGLRFWKKSPRPGSGGDGKPADASRTGCGSFFRRIRGPRKAPGEKASVAQQETVDDRQAQTTSSQPPAAAAEIVFHDIELPDDVKHPAVCGDADSDGSSVHSVCEEIVCLKARQAESAWVRPPVAPAGPTKEKPKLALAKMASKDGGGTPDDQPRRPSADKQPVTRAQSIDVDQPIDEAEAERQRMAEARFQRKSVDMRSVKAKGGVKIEQSPQSEMWWNIVNKSLVGTGLFARAAACSLQSGGIYACNPADYAPTTDQVAALRDNFQNPGAFAAAGFAIGGVIYKVQPEGCTRELLSAVNLQHTEGLLIVKSQTALLVGGFSGSRDQAQETLCAMRDLFVSQGL